MSMVPGIPGLPCDDSDEREVLLEARRRMRDDRELGSAILTIGDGRVTVRCRLHLLEPAAEAAVRRELLRVDSDIALLRHGRDDADGRDRLHTATHRHGELERELAQSVVELDVTGGPPAVAGGEWTLADLPWNVVDIAHERSAVLRRQLVR